MQLSTARNAAGDRGGAKPLNIFCIEGISYIRKKTHCALEDNVTDTASASSDKTWTEKLPPRHRRGPNGGAMLLCYDIMK